jgi:hypothetical protein
VLPTIAQKYLSTYLIFEPFLSTASKGNCYTGENVMAGKEQVITVNALPGFSTDRHYQA